MPAKISDRVVGLVSSSWLLGEEVGDWLLVKSDCCVKTLVDGCWETTGRLAGLTGEWLLDR